MNYFYSIFFGTFLLEDLALISGIALVSENKISFSSAFLACFFGIAIGDIGLYGIGYLASRFTFVNQLGFLKRHRYALSRLKKSELLTYSIFISRLIPGTRLTTYLGAGFLHYSFIKFVVVTIISCYLWVLTALYGGETLNHIFKDHWVLALLSFLVFLEIVKSVVPKLTDTWPRKAFFHSWRKWAHFEFWPGSLFYLPLIPYYIYLSVKNRSPFMPFYARPHRLHGGLIGESKWDFLRLLNSADSSTLKAIKIHRDAGFLETRSLILRQSISYPFIVKPVVGQRRFGVRVLNNDFDLSEYLLLSHFDSVVQELSQLPFEAGIFYVRRPSEQVGRIFSVTDKSFPFVTGDGKTKLGDLILKDKRARIIAPIYFAKLKKQLDSVPHDQEIVVLYGWGNHAQGAIYRNGVELMTDKLTLELDRISRQIPDFYFGRFEIRYRDAESLKQGRNFEILSVDGAGSEATHIWDAKTSLSEAYASLFEQWALLFEIGKSVSRMPGKKNKINLTSFIQDCIRFNFRKRTY